MENAAIFKAHFLPEIIIIKIIVIVISACCQCRCCLPSYDSKNNYDTQYRISVDGEREEKRMRTSKKNFLFRNQDKYRVGKLECILIMQTIELCHGIHEK
jgi:hypothetical protein